MPFGGQLNVDGDDDGDEEMTTQKVYLKSLSIDVK